MSKRFLFVVLPLLVLAAIFAVPQIPHAHAATTGVVCMEDFTTVPVTDSAPCSHTPLPGFDGPFIATPANHQIQFGVYVQGSDPLNGWDITLLADHNFLVPFSVDPTHSMVGPENIAGSSLSVVVLCMQGVLKIGTTCLSTDTIDTLHYSVVGGKTLAAPSTGLLFTAVYNITGQTPAAGITIGYQTGCAGTVSVPGQCVTITNGTPSPDSETSQTANFDNSGTPSTGGTGVSGVPFVTITAAPTSLNLVAGASGSVTLTVFGQNGWPGLTTPDQVTFTFIASPGLSVGLAAGTTCGPAAVSCSPPAITISAANAGNYCVTFFANYLPISFTTGRTNTLFAPVTVCVHVTSYSWTVTPLILDIPIGGPFAVATGTVTSLNGFAGTVTFNSLVNPATGLTASFNPTSVVLAAGGTATTTISFTATLQNKYTAALRAASGTLLKSVSTTVYVNSFTVTANPSTVTFTTTAGSGTGGLMVQGLPAANTVFGFGIVPSLSTVTFTTSVTPAGLTASCTSLTVPPPAGNSITSTNNCTFTSTTAGVYTVTITGHSGSVLVTGGLGIITSSTTVTVTVTGGVAGPTITTVIKDATNTGVTTVAVGTAVHDTAVISGGSTSGVTGTVTYNFFSTGTCTGAAVTQVVTVGTGGVVPDSTPRTPTPAGSYSYNAVYSGDANNAAATSTCEPLTVNKLSPTIATTVLPTSAPVGNNVFRDTAILTGGFQAGGTVTYTLFSNGACTGTGTIISTVTVTNGVVPDSAIISPTSAGSYAFNAVYSGDASNNGATSTCEPFTVQKELPGIATTVSALTSTVGTPVHDSSTLTNSFQASGTVTYTLFSNGACTGTGTVVSTVTVTNSVIPDSASATPTPAGSYSFQATYSGDANNNPAVSSCEPFTVNPISGVAISTSLSATTVVVGGSAFDTAILTGATATASGTVTYNLFTTGTCAGTPSVVSMVTVTSGVVPNSASHTFTAAGSYSWNAVYSGDANNAGATSACEPQSVSKISPSISTTLSALTINAGGSVSDSATLTGATSAAGGTVTYEFFSGGTCSGTPTTVGTPVTVTNGIVPNSASQTFGTAGSFSWNAVYAGDANNNGATSACEPLTVNTVLVPDFTLTQTSSTINFKAGATGTDSLTVAAVNGFTGTVTFTSVITPLTGLTVSCTSVTLTATITSGSSTCTFTSSTAGSYSAVVTGTSGTLSHPVTYTVTVAKATPTIATTLSASAITAGGSVTDSATLTGATSAAGGVVTYEFFSSSSCSGTATTVGTPVTVTNGAVPDSASHTFSTTGSFSWNAIYTGDANNNVATSSCEPLTVTPVADFTMVPVLNTVTLTSGLTSTDVIMVTGIGGFADTISFTTSVTPSTGLTASCTSVTLTATSPAQASTCTFSSSTPGTYAVVVTGTGATSGKSHQVTITVIVNPVSKNSPTIATTLSATTITAGASVSDSATLTGATSSASGTVTYEFFNGAICAGAATTVGTTVTVANGIVPNSASHTFNAAGSFSWNAIYSGDANNNGATSPCEPLTVNKATPTIATTLSATTITVGGSVTDSSALTGSFQAGGTVTYEFFAGATCTGTATTVGTPVTVTNGIVPNSTSQIFSSAGSFSWNAIYSGDANNAGATSACEPLTVTSTTGSPVLLRFSGFDLDDYQNGVGQLQVFVNGHLVADIPAGVNHLSGSGDFAAYNTWVKFGPFDITSFVVNGQNTILFKNPLSSHSGLIRNVTITQGDTVLLHVRGTRSVSPGHSVTYTFSIPPLTVNNLTSSTLTPTIGQNDTFTATYAGGTGPFKCFFSFGEDSFAMVNGSAGMCTVTHRYDDSGTFSVRVAILGSSTSDFVISRLNVTVADD